MLKINSNIFCNTYKKINKQFLIKQKKDICTFSGNTNYSDDLIPTTEEIHNVINHLPKSENEAEKIAKQDVEVLILQINDLIERDNIHTPEDYKNYMEDYIILGKKVFDKMSHEQKVRSIMLQEKSVEEMNKQKLKIISSSKSHELMTLLDTQIQISIDTLQYCKEHL